MGDRRHLVSSNGLLETEGAAVAVSLSIEVFNSYSDASSAIFSEDIISIETYTDAWLVLILFGVIYGVTIGLHILYEFLLWSKKVGFSFYKCCCGNINDKSNNNNNNTIVVPSISNIDDDDDDGDENPVQEKKNALKSLNNGDSNNNPRVLSAKAIREYVNSMFPAIYNRRSISLWRFISEIATQHVFFTLFSH